MIAKKNIYKFYYLFLLIHLSLWSLIPSLSNVNLPLDTIEALAWGSNLDWGFNKHPPLSAFFVEVFYQIFGNQDWAYYFLSQIFITFTFIVIFKFALKFFDNLNYALFSVLLLEGIFFYNFTTPEFNVNIAQLPFWVLSIFFTWNCVKYNRSSDYILLGLVIGLGILSKYLFLYLVAGIILFFIYQLILKNKNIKIYNLIILALVSFIILSPHIYWLTKNNFTTLTYALNRTGGIGNFSDHIIFPLTFIIKQIGILIPFFVLAYFLIKKFNIKRFVIDNRKIFLFFTVLIPIILMIFTSLVLGVKIRTMWMTPFYTFFGVLFLEIFKKNINLDNFKKFFIFFIVIFLISPFTYLAISLSNDFKRTDYPGKEIARLVQNKWDDNFKNDIKIVVGDEWFAGNLSYHLISRPKWIIDLKGKASELNNLDGIIYTGNPKVLKQVCPGVFGTIKPVGYCMIGIR